MALLQSKLGSTEHELIGISNQVEVLLTRKATLEAKIQQYKRFILGNTDSAIVVDSDKEDRRSSHRMVFDLTKNPSTYEASGSQYDKLLYIINRPWKYGRRSFVGAKPVVEAVRIEDVEQRDEAEETLMKRIGPALSRMAKEGKLIKMAERKHPLRVHYLSPTWFENGVLKPQHKEQLSPFDLVEVTPRQQSTEQELLLPEQVMPEQVLVDKDTEQIMHSNSIDIEEEPTSPLEAEEFGF